MMIEKGGLKRRYNHAQETLCMFFKLFKIYYGNAQTLRFREREKKLIQEPGHRLIRLFSNSVLMSPKARILCTIPVGT